MNFIKRYWFGAFIGFFLACFVCVFIIVLLAPKQDLKGRGFIPCTENMVETLFDCEKRLWCSAQAIVDNNICVLGIIGTGLKDWVSGKQSTPWDNYIFTPELYQEDIVDEEARKQYLAKYPDTKEEIKRLHRLRKVMENEDNKQIESEGNWKQGY